MRLAGDILQQTHVFKDDSELLLAIRVQERDAVEAMIQHCLDGMLSPWSLPLLWGAFQDLLNWCPGDAKDLLECFVVDYPDAVADMKAPFDPDNPLITKGSYFFGYQRNLWARCLVELGQIHQDTRRLA